MYCAGLNHKPRLDRTPLHDMFGKEITFSVKNVAPSILQVILDNKHLLVQI